MKARVTIGLNAVIVAVTQETPRVLTVRHTDEDLQERQATGSVIAPGGLPFGPLDPAQDVTLERGLRGWVKEQTGIDLGYVEQLYTFADQNRDPSFYRRGERVISVAYLALVRETPLTVKGARWRNWYGFLPWEDWREGRPALIDREILLALKEWIRTTPERSLERVRKERVDLAYGTSGVPWNWERALDRYELLYEAGLVAEARRDTQLSESSGLLSGRPEISTGPAAEPRPSLDSLGLPMTMDHRRILATALDRIRGKLKYRPVVFELLPPLFTLFQLQRLVESLAGIRLHKQNFRRLVEKGGLVEGTGQFFHETGGRPAELFCFRREVVRERSAPGIGLPAAH